MSELLNKVNPGLKSRVSDVIDFLDNAATAAELAAQQLDERRLKLPDDLGPAASSGGRRGSPPRRAGPTGATSRLRAPRHGGVRHARLRR